MFNPSELAHFLVNIMYRKDDFEAIVLETGYQPGYMNITNSAINNWTFFVGDTERDGRVNLLLEAVKKRKPQNVYINALLEDINTSFKNPYARSDIRLDNVDKIRNNQALTTASNTIFPISFLELGMMKARCVAMVRTPGTIGTGFVIEDDYFMTNNHVVSSKRVAGQSIITFNFERDYNNKFKPVNRVSLDPEAGFATDAKADWTVVKLRKNPLRKDEFLEFAAHEVQEDDFVNIIQHPGGDEKKIAMYHNIVTSVKKGIVQYLTDTQEGSSGSPVFNSSWAVVALHHSNTRYAEGTEPDKLCNQGTSAQVLKKQVQKKLPGLKLSSSHAAND